MKPPRPPPIIRWSTKRNDAGVFAALDALRQVGRKILAKRSRTIAARKRRESASVLRTASACSAILATPTSPKDYAHGQ